MDKCCISFCKDTNLKANHNWYRLVFFLARAVFPFAKILIWKQITTSYLTFHFLVSCIPFCKDTNLKANHNCLYGPLHDRRAVFPFAKILIWKQITTVCVKGELVARCIPFCKDTNLKANHNRSRHPYKG